MKCYNHADVDAVGTCKNCCKGICHECITDTYKGIACTATCVEDTVFLNILVEKQKKNNLETLAAVFNNGAVYFAIGVVSLGYSISKDDGAPILFVLGLLLMGWGFLNFITSREKNK